MSKPSPANARNSADSGQHQRDRLLGLLAEAQSIRPGVKLLLALLVGGGVVLAISAVVLITLFSQRIYIAKAPLLEKVTTAAGNGADLAALQHLYATANKTNKSPRLLLANNAYYTADSGLRRVLLDARSQQFLAAKPNTTVLGRIDALIAEQQASNPFEGLASTQRQHFDSVREKLGGEYPAVQPEMDRLADALQYQNELVTRYLKDSTVSFWVSITGLVFSLLVGVGQLLQGQQQRINRVLAETSAAVIRQMRERSGGDNTPTNR